MLKYNHQIFGGRQTAERNEALMKQTQKIRTLEVVEILDATTTAITTNDRISYVSLAAQFLSVKVARGEISEISAKAYQAPVTKLAIFLDDRNIVIPTEDNIYSYRADLVNAGLKPATIAKHLTVARLFFKWLGKKLHNAELAIVADDIKAPKFDRLATKREFLNAAQAKSVITNIDRTTLMGKRDFAIVSLMLTTGLRTCEVVRANVGDIQNTAAGTVLYVQGKGHTEKDRYVKLTARVVAAIRDYLTARGTADEDSPLFTSTSPNNKGGRLTTRSISNVAKNSMKSAGLDRPTLTAHSFRHTAAVLNMRAGGSLFETQQLLRHASPATTEIYAHILDRMNNYSESRIETAIFAAD